MEITFRMRASPTVLPGAIDVPKGGRRREHSSDDRAYPGTYPRAGRRRYTAISRAFQLTKRRFCCEGTRKASPSDRSPYPRVP